MFSILSLRSTEFYIIIAIIIIFAYVIEKNKNIVKNQLKSGFSRGIVTGLILGGYEGMLPAAVLLSFLNIISHHLELFLGHLTTII